MPCYHSSTRTIRIASFSYPRKSPMKICFSSIFGLLMAAFISFGQSPAQPAPITGVLEQRSSRRLLDRPRCRSYAARSRSHPPCTRCAALRTPKRSVPVSKVDLRSWKEPGLLPRNNSYRTWHGSVLFEPPFPAGPGPSAAVSDSPRLQTRSPVSKTCMSFS